jgi:hypothetical protein
MTTYFVDPIAGNNSNAGTSYATAVANLNAAALSSATDGDEIRILGNDPVSIYGDNSTWTFQVPMGLYAGLAISNATNASPIQVTATGHGFSTGDWVFISSITGNTNANGEWKITVVDSNNFTLDNSSGNAAYVSGGTVLERSGCHISFTSPQVKNISLNGNIGQTAYPYNAGLWTLSSNITGSLSTNPVRHYNNSLNINVGGSFTTGLIAYQALGSTIDFSAYTHISFSIQLTSGPTFASNVYYIVLCSDAAGTNIVDTFYIPALTLISTPNYWSQLVLQKNGGGNLGSNIQSIAIYRTTSVGNHIFYLTNICASQKGTNRVNLRSLISLEDTVTGGDFFGWYSLASLDQDGAVLNFIQVPSTGNTRGYYGRPNGTGTFKTRKLDPYDLGDFPMSVTAINTIGFGGTAAPVIVRGGYSAASNMTAVTSISAFSTSNNYGYMFYCVNKNYISFENLSCNYCNNGFYLATADNIVFKNIHGSACNNVIITNSPSNYLRIGVDYDNVTTYPCYATLSATGFSLGSAPGALVKSSYLLSNQNYGAAVSAGSSLIDSNTIYNCSSGTSGGGALITATSGNKISNCDIRYNCGSQITINGSSYNCIKDCTIYGNLVSTTTSMIALSNVACNNIFSGNNLFNGPNGYLFGFSASSNSVYNGTSTGLTGNTFSLSGCSLINVVNCSGVRTTTPYVGTTAGSQISFTRCTDSSGNPLNGTYGDSYSWVLSTDYVHGATTSSWAVTLPITIPNDNCHGFASPVCMPITTVPCLSGITYTFKAWVLRADTALIGYLLVNGGCAAGISTDIVSANTSAATGVWEQLTVSFSTTTDAIVTVYAAQYGYSSSSIYWGDSSLTQI